MLGPSQVQTTRSPLRWRKPPAQRGVAPTYEPIRRWCRTFGPAYARTLRRPGIDEVWHLDELFVTIQGWQQCLSRAVDNDCM